MDILGHGIYSFPEAARLIKLRTGRVRSWFTLPEGRSPVFTCSYKSISAISFLDLIEVLVAGNLREAGVSLQAIRKVYRKLTEQFGTEHPFCHQYLLTDGQNVFAKTATDEHEEEMVDVLKSQQVFPRILLPYLQRVTYDDVNQLAREWNVYNGVVIDPTRSCGKPIVQTCALPASILASAYRANNKNAEMVAEWYGITVDDVMSAVDFEFTYLGKAA